MIAVSSCLLGYSVRYDGKHQLYSPLKQLHDRGLVIGICPEILGGLPTPRPSAEIVGGNGEDVLQGKAKVIEVSGDDVTEQYIAGAKVALDQLKQHNISLVVLKANSPSCGSKLIYSGLFDGTVKEGFGVCTALFRQHNIKVFDENEPNLIDEIKRYLLRK
ncbi:DUF523 domain-containing protein [Providencia burhodogranariea]|uniref:Uncharacterized protein n=1 Tax=Providencia burhodogranariea DSM 19968 TaxID=1141662 RepID=K8X1X0_9GAMM|nr:DUF523 domain-containing protein [Providencia burhodogranariea]EKT62465.1 hypothetical protein OOA_07755 [Providencia burhodogranariea DSM 19968]